MRIIYIFYIACHLGNQTMIFTLTGFQGIKHLIQYMDSHPHKPIFYPYNYFDEYNVIRLTWIGNQVEYYTTHNFLEFHQDAYHARFINRRPSVSDINNSLLVVAGWWKVQIQPDVASESTDG